MSMFATDGRVQGSVAQCERDHADAILSLAKAEAVFDGAVQAYDAALGQGREAARAARQAQSDAEVDRDIARHAVERLGVQLQTAREAAAAADLERLTTDARTRVSNFQVAATRELKAMAASARRLARLWAEAELARDAALRAGASDVDLPEVEGFRDVPRLPKKVIETKRVTRWINPRTGDPLNDEQTARVSVSLGEAYLSGGQASTLLSGQGVYDRNVYLPPQRSIRAASLVSALSVPGLMADDMPGWSAPDVTAPHAVLAHLDALEGASGPDRTDRRARQVELVSVSSTELHSDPARAAKASAA